MGKSFIIAAATAGLVLAQPAFGQTDETKLGKVHFETSCKPDAQTHFDRAMLYQHSFWYRASQQAFEDALKADPECGIAYWGIALSLLLNPHVAPPAKNLADGAAAIGKGKSVGAKTQRERDYIDALAVMYADYEKVDHRTRIQAYSKAMEQVRSVIRTTTRRRFTTRWRSIPRLRRPTNLRQPAQGAAILEPIAERQPQHPGSHYLIHLYDYPPIAEKGLNAARLYARSPPPRHANTCPRTSSHASGTGRSRSTPNRCRSVCEGRISRPAACEDYQVYAYQQLGQDANARAVIDEMTTVTGFTETYFVGPYDLAASPARYALERGDWKAAAELTVRPSPLAHIQAITHFARALGAARSGNPEAAKADIARLGELREKLREAKDAYWSGQVDIEAQVASAWVLEAEGKHDDALQAMSAAADAEDRTEKHPVTPGVPKPARELFGTMLLERGRPAEALAAFEATLKKEPGRSGAGAAKAAEMSGDKIKARDYSAKIVAIAGGADQTRTEVADARALLKQP